MILAHETWFESHAPAADWGFAGQGATLAMLAAAVAITLAVRLVSRLWNGADVPFLARLAPWMPFALRLHLAVSLIGLLSMGVYLSPAMDLDGSVGSVLLGAGMALVAVSMASGYRVREAALLLVALGPVGMLEFGVVDVLARLDLLGLALFVLVTGPGRWSADAETGRVELPGIPELGRGAWALKVAAGSALIVVAFQEKLANPDLARRFLADRPDFNVANSLLGLDWTDTQFIRVAGAIEVLFGLLLISGCLPQLVVIAAGIPFNATLFFFGTPELLGHLPIYGTMLTLLVFGSHPELRRAVGALRPP
jgi:hypothetical protein